MVSFLAGMPILGGGSAKVELIDQTFSQSSSSSSSTVTLPASIAGDLLVLQVGMTQGTSGMSLNTPSGWTVGTSTVGTNALRRQVILWKYSSGSEPSTITITANISGAMFTMGLSFRGVGEDPQFGVVRVQNSSNTMSPNGGYSSYSGEKLWVNMVVNETFVAGGLTYPSGWTDSITYAGSVGSNPARVNAVFKRSLAYTETPGTYTASSGSPNWLSVVMSLVPSRPSGGPPQIEYLGSAALQPLSNSTSKTWSSAPLGDAADDRCILLATIGLFAGTSNIIGVTVNGYPLSQIYNPGGSGVAFYWGGIVPTGTSGDVVITRSSGITESWLVSMYAIYNFKSYEPIHTDTATPGSTLASPINSSPTFTGIPSGGAYILDVIGLSTGSAPVFTSTPSYGANSVDSTTGDRLISLPVGTTNGSDVSITYSFSWTGGANSGSTRASLLVFK